MSILWLPVIELAIGLPIALYIRGKRKAAPVQEQGAEVQTSASVEIALRSAFQSLTRQRGGGYGPWLSCCIDRINKGLPVPTEIAVGAIRKTLGEVDACGRLDGEGLREALGMLGE